MENFKTEIVPFISVCEKHFFRSEKVLELQDGSTADAEHSPHTTGVQLDAFGESAQDMFESRTVAFVQKQSEYLKNVGVLIRNISTIVFKVITFLGFMPFLMIVTIRGLTAEVSLLRIFGELPFPVTP